MSDHILSREEVLKAIWTDDEFSSASRNLLDDNDANLRAQVAGLEAGIAKIPHALDCRKLQCGGRHMSTSWETCAICTCSCQLSTLSDPIARGRGLLALREVAAKLVQFESDHGLIPNEKAASQDKLDALVEELKRLKGESK